MTHLTMGQPAPDFTAPTASNPTFTLSTAAGRYILLCFTPRDAERRDAALAALRAHRDLLSDDHVAAFIVLRDRETWARAREAPGFYWFLDTDGEVSRLYGAVTPEGEDAPMWMLLDPAQRVMTFGGLHLAKAMFRRISSLPPVDGHAGVPMTAPVLIVPRVFEPELCRRLIGVYEAQGGGLPSGVMRQVGDRTVGVLDDTKRRTDAYIDDEALRNEIRVRLNLRLLPEIAKAFQFQVTPLERYLVACYAAEDGGYFQPHRDDTTLGTAHRRFAVSINLNAEEFEGGDLREWA